MSDQLIETPVQQSSGQQAGSTPPGGDWESRYKGTVPVIERLTLENRNLQTQLAAKASEVEQLKAQLSLKDAEKTGAVGERDNQITQLIEAKTTLEKQVGTLNAEVLKVKVAKKLGKPELLEILDQIPAVGDEEALTNIMSEFANWGEKLVQKREKELLTGVSPAAPPVSQTAAEALPTTSDGWTKYMEKFPLGSPERQKAYDHWRVWGASQSQ